LEYWEWEYFRTGAAYKPDHRKQSCSSKVTDKKIHFSVDYSDCKNNQSYDKVLYEISIKDFFFIKQNLIHSI
jgi:hypothetical protein